MKSAALTRRLARSFPEPPPDIFVTWFDGTEITETYTIRNNQVVNVERKTMGSSSPASPK